jgi:hypothetical protein
MPAAREEAWGWGAYHGQTRPSRPAIFRHGGARYRGRDSCREIHYLSWRGTATIPYGESGDQQMCSAGTRFRSVRGKFWRIAQRRSVRDEKITFAELPINVITWIGVPNEARDFHKKFAVSPEPRVTHLKKRQRSATDPRILRSEHTIDVRPRYCAVVNHKQLCG